MLSVALSEVFTPDMIDPRFPVRATPRPGASEWWTGDPQSLPRLKLERGHPRLVIRRNILSPVKCAGLIDCWRRNRAKIATDLAHDFWAERIIQHGDLDQAEEIDALRVMQQARLLTQISIVERFAPPGPIYADSAQLVVWREGAGLKPHVDNLEPDGRPNATPHRSYSSIIYLNDDYEGGEIYFPLLGIRIKPEAGLLVAFTAGTEHVHGVTDITSGERFTLAGWFTGDASKADSDARDVI